MIIRVCRVVASALAVLLIALGLLTYPGAVAIMWAVALLFGGPCIGLSIYSGGIYGGGTGGGGIAAHRENGPVRRRGDAVRGGAVATAVMLTASAVGAGLAALLGPMAAAVIPVLVAGGGVWAWRHRSEWPVPSTRRPVAEVHSSGPVDAPPAPIVIGDMSAAQLCAVWHHTYWTLLGLPAGHRRCELVGVRQAVLDELDRRDPEGFARWLATEPRASSDPGRFLADTSHDPARPDGVAHHEGDNG